MKTWVTIQDFELAYEINKKGNIRRIGSKIILKKRVGGEGYWVVTLTRKKIGNKRYPARVHRLLMIAFTPNPENKPCINHMDGIKLNISLGNLEWATVKENNDHTVRLKLNNPPLGEKHWCSKLTNNIVLTIFNSRSTHIVIAEQYNINQATVGAIKCGKTWSNVTGKKDIRKRRPHFSR